MTTLPTNNYLPKPVAPIIPPKIKTLNEVVAEHIEMVLKHNKYNISKTAKLLEMSKATLYRRIKEFEIAIKRG